MAERRGLRSLRGDVHLKQNIVVCAEKERRINEDKMEIIPIRNFPQDLWEDF